MPGQGWGGIPRQTDESWRPAEDGGAVNDQIYGAGIIVRITAVFVLSCEVGILL